jgi:hypothetical protein
MVSPRRTGCLAQGTPCFAKIVPDACPMRRQYGRHGETGDGKLLLSVGQGGGTLVGEGDGLVGETGGWEGHESASFRRRQICAVRQWRRLGGGVGHPPNSVERSLRPSSAFTILSHSLVDIFPSLYHLWLCENPFSKKIIYSLNNLILFYGAC